MIRRRSTQLLISVLAILGLSTAASAYWTTTGTGTASGSTASFSAPTNVIASGGINQAQVSWTGSTLSNGTPAQGYYIERLGGSPSPAQACGTNAANPATYVAHSAGTITCTDSGLAPGTYTYRVTAVYRSWTAQSAASGAATVTTATVDHFVVSPPSSATAGGSFSVTVTAKDVANNTVTGYAGTIHFTSSDAQAAVPADYSFVAGDNGTRSFTATLKTAGSKTITVNDTAQPAKMGTATIAVNAGAASSLVVSGFPSPTTAGVSGNFTVTAKDAFGNAATGYTGTVHFTNSDEQAALPSDYTFVAADNGTRTFSATLKTAGTRSITATDTVAASITGSQTGISVTAGPVSALVFSTQPASGTAGSALSPQPVVTAHDAFGNTVTSYAGTVGLSIKSGTGASGAALTGCTASAPSNGVTTFSGCKIDKSGTAYVLTASDGTRSVDSAAFSVSAGPLAKLVFSTQPGNGNAGLPLPTQPVVTAQDASGNTVTSYAGTVTLSIKSGTGISGAALTGCTSAGPSSGVTTFSGCTIDKSGTGYVVTASDGTFSVDSSTFNVGAGAPVGISLTNAFRGSAPGTPSTLTYGGTISARTCSTEPTTGNTRSFTANISLVDAGGNVVSNNTGSSITFTLSASASTAGNVSPTSVTIATGANISSSAFNLPMRNGAETRTLTATGSINGNSVSLTCTVG